jgi:hypothetical protein
MKSKLSLILGGLFLLAQTAMAQTAITLSASIPAATGLTLTVNTIPASTGVFPASGAVVNPGAISFGNLVYDTAGTPPANIWLGSNYYAIDVTASSGAGVPVVNVTYSEGTGTQCPNIAAGTSSTLGCLGTKTTAAFDTVTTASGSDKLSPLGVKRLIDLVPGGTVGEMPAADIPTGGWERVYVAIFAGGSTPATSKPFTNADAPGTYSGTLTFTAVSG